MIKVIWKFDIFLQGGRFLPLRNFLMPFVVTFDKNIYSCYLNDFS